MSTIGLFYGSDTGNTEAVADTIEQKIDSLEVVNVSECTVESYVPFSKIILGVPTWYDGELQSDWDFFFEKFQTVDFTGKQVAIFGLGDQFSYGEWFVDGIGILAQVVMDNGGEIVGLTSIEGYDYDNSRAEVEIEGETYFLGLALDDDNQKEMTASRLDNWLAQIMEEFN